MANTLSEFPTGKVALLRNEICAYCAIPLTPETRTKEHVVGRNFVPKGKMDKAWNLIVYACASCNNQKGDLENDLSAITMQPHPFGHAGEYDEAVVKIARAKAEKSISRRTRKTVQNSQESLAVSLPLAQGINVTLNMVAPAQVSAPVCLIWLATSLRRSSTG